MYMAQDETASCVQGERDKIETKYCEFSLLLIINRTT